MCSLSEVNPNDIEEIHDRIGHFELRNINIPVNSERSIILDLTQNDNDQETEVCDILNKTYQIQSPTLPHYRKEIIKDTSPILGEAFGKTHCSKIADVVNVHGGSVHIGHVVNITEQIVFNADKNELELNNHKTRDYSQYFNMVDRMHWLAQPGVAKINYLKSAAKYIIICHTATEEAFTQAENVLMLRLLQTFHIESRGWADIAYNFCVGSDGNVYEGRSWFREGSHTVTYNKYSIGIAFIGCFLKHLPPRTALKRCQELIEHGVKIGAVRPDYELIAHRQCRPFLSPGDKLFEEIQTWKNFNPNITNTSPCIFNQ